MVFADVDRTLEPENQIEKEAEMKKILVATDGSELGQAAIEAGLELARDEDAELVFVHVISVFDFAPQMDGAEVPPQRIPRVEDDPVLCDAMGRAERQGLGAKAELLVGYPPKQILRLAHDIDADVIVVGSRGFGPFKSAMVGSTSREILAHADRKVLVVRDEAAREQTAVTSK
jgi:nucleotide-binding universal stress UspA family protein